MIFTFLERSHDVKKSKFTWALSFHVMYQGCFLPSSNVHSNHPLPGMMTSRSSMTETILQGRALALIDANNFYVSCEQVFNPALGFWMAFKT